MMRALSTAAVLATVVSGVPRRTAADIIDETAASKKVYFNQAPAQVRRDLLSIFAGCGTSPDIVRSTAIVEQGSYGGPGSHDFQFAFTKEDWPRKWNSAEYPSGGRCTGNYAWFVLWMSLPGGTYKQLVFVGDGLFSRGNRYIILDVGCGDSPWWSWGRLVSWSVTRHAFVPVTKCMKTEAAQAWLKSHGYQ